MPRRPRPRQRLEKFEQADSAALLTSVGGKVYVLGTRRPRGRNCPTCGTFVAEHQGTRQTPGIADLFCFLPPTATDDGRAVWVESKARDGRLSAEQKDFRDWCQRVALDHITGGLEAVIAWLVWRGRLKTSQVPHYRAPGGTAGRVL